MNCTQLPTKREHGVFLSVSIPFIFQLNHKIVSKLWMESRGLLEETGNPHSFNVFDILLCV